MTDFPESGAVESWALTVQTLSPITQGWSNEALPVPPARSRTSVTPVRGGFGERFLAGVPLRMGCELGDTTRRSGRAEAMARRELRAGGNGGRVAFQAWTRLSRSHHPEASLSEPRRPVAERIDHHVPRGDPGPVPGCG